MRGLAVNSKQMRLIFTEDDLFKHDIDLQKDVKSTQFWNNRCYSAINNYVASKDGVVIDEPVELEVAIEENDLGNLGDG